MRQTTLCDFNTYSCRRTIGDAQTKKKNIIWSYSYKNQNKNEYGKSVQRFPRCVAVAYIITKSIYRVTNILFSWSVYWRRVLTLCTWYWTTYVLTQYTLINVNTIRVYIIIVFESYVEIVRLRQIFYNIL